MKIVIAGAGEVGTHLAELLSQEAQDIILIDQDKFRLQQVESHLDVITLRGNATSPSILAKAHIDRTALLIAATDSETEQPRHRHHRQKARCQAHHRTHQRIRNSSTRRSIDMTRLGHRCPGITGDLGERGDHCTW